MLEAAFIRSLNWYCTCAASLSAAVLAAKAYRTRRDVDDNSVTPSKELPDAEPFQGSMDNDSARMAHTDEDSRDRAPESGIE